MEIHSIVLDSVVAAETQDVTLTPSVDPVVGGDTLTPAVSDEGGMATEDTATVMTEAAPVEQEQEWFPLLGFDLVEPQLVGAAEEFSGFLKMVKWAPDGSSLLAASEDNTIRLFHDAAYCAIAGDGNVRQLQSTVRIHEGEAIYDTCWYPLLRAEDPATCCFATTSRDHPIHLYDAMTGSLRCSYRGYNQMDEITAALSVTFNPTGNRIYAGYNKVIRIFDVSVPGREYSTLETAGKNSTHKLSGIVSTLHFNPDYSGMLAAGTHSNEVGVYSSNEGNKAICVLQCRSGAGVTQVLFSPCGRFLFVGCRKSQAIQCWDIRGTGEVLYELPREAPTNQRITFDVDPSGTFLVTGSMDGSVHTYNIKDSGKLVRTYKAHADTVNGCSLHPTAALLATSSGQRKFPLPPPYAENSEESIKDERVLIWSCPRPTIAI